MIETGSDILDLDWMVDIGSAKRLLQDKTTILCGNYDPVAVLLQGSPEKIARKVNECADAVGSYYLSSAGCEVPRDTPAENLLAVADGAAAAKDAKRIKKRYPKFRISFSFTIQSVLFYATEDSSKGSAPTQEE